MWNGILLAAAAIGCGRINFDEDPVRVSSVVIADGAELAIGPRFDTAVTVAGSYPPFLVRAAFAASAGTPCETTRGDDGWTEYLEPSTLLVRFAEAVDGDKKLCVWAKDALGHDSAARDRSGVDMDTIRYATEHPPVIEAFEVKNANASRTAALGDPLVATFTLSDVEGLADAPLSLWYQTGAAWSPIANDVGASGGDTTWSASYTFPAPSAQGFRIKLIARDHAGNASVPAVSDVLNVPGWSVYLGSSDPGIGSTARSLRLVMRTNHRGYFDFDPRTGDVYVVDDIVGVVHVDARTGSTQLAFARGTTNLPIDGPLPLAPVVTEPTVTFGPDGRLYLGVQPGPSFDGRVSGFIYQVDLDQRTVRRYLGGGTVNDDTATPATAFAFPHAVAFDEDSTLYFLASCSPGTFDGSSTARLMKVVQNPDGTPGRVSAVAGNCVKGTPGPGPQPALSVPLTSGLVSISTIAAWDRGRVVYVGALNGRIVKILDGQTYTTDLPADTLSVARSRVGTLGVAHLGVDEYQPGLAGNGGEIVIRTIGSETGTGACTADNVAAPDACVRVGFTVRSGPDDRWYFQDGPSINDHRSYRVRFVDDSGRLRTLVGTPPFVGEGRDRRLAKGTFAGIVAKPSTAPNQQAFPPGLYFLDSTAAVLGHVDPVTDRIAIDWGNASGAATTYTTGDPIGTHRSLGLPYSGGDVQALAFDSNGLPWLRYGPLDARSVLVSVDVNRRVVQRQHGMSIGWEVAPDGTDPVTINLWPYTATRNLAIAASSVFTIGGWVSAGTPAAIKMLDFATNTTTRILGQDLAEGAALDTVTPGTARTSTLSGVCHDLAPCFLVYRADQDRLYFSEGASIRYITTPRSPATSILQTLFALPSGLTVQNFSFRPDGLQVFYLANNVLRCHDLGSGSAWCNDQSLGPPLPLRGINSNGDQLTWLDAGTLLVSSNSAEVYAYTLPPP